MNNKSEISNATGTSFLDYILKDATTRKYLLIALGLSIAQFVVFKLMYPFADFFSDSYSYIWAAYQHAEISIWPIGYSKFLSLFHTLTHSDTALVAFQYFFMQFSALYFFFSIQYYFKTSPWSRKILFAFLFINPLSFYLCNTINSDAIFAALSILWLTELLWILRRPRIYQLLTQAVLLFLCFTIRNNAYYYPLISIFAFILSDWNWKIKLTGIVLPFLFIIPFIIQTQNAAYKLTGTRQFSLFTGWQLANNALYIYDQIEVDSTELPTPEAKEINRLSIHFFKTVNPKGYRSFIESFVGNFFIKYSTAPLKIYYSQHFTPNGQIELNRDWGKASADFEPFGKYIILHHPIAYARYFMWPNTWHYFFPPLSHLGLYNYGENKIQKIAQTWFDYPKAEVRSISPILQGEILIIYVAFFMLFNLYFLWQLGRLLLKIYMDSFPARLPAFWMITAFLLCNFGFTIFSTVNILRYQVVPMILLISFGGLINDLIASKSTQKMKPGSKNNTETSILPVI